MSVHALKYMNVMPYSAKCWRGETLAKSLYSCNWKVKLWGELSRFSIAFQCINNIWMGKLWRIDGQSPNSPMFSSTNVLCYTVLCNRIMRDCIMQKYFRLNASACITHYIHSISKSFINI